MNLIFKNNSKVNVLYFVVAVLYFNKYINNSFIAFLFLILSVLVIREQVAILDEIFYQLKQELLKVDPETTKFFGGLAWQQTKLIASAGMKAGPPILKICIGCLGAAAAFNGGIGEITGGQLRPATDLADVARGAACKETMAAKYVDYYNGK
jgi:purine-cytosine permease-like protein